MSALAEQPKIGRPRKFQSVEELEAGIDAYFAECDAREKPYTMAGLARTLDCSRTTLLNYENEAKLTQIPENARRAFVSAVKKARARVEQWTEERLFGRGHPAGPIFSLKNNFGWKDVQEVEHTHTLIAIGQPGGGLAPQLEPPAIDAQIVERNPSFASALSPPDTPEDGCK